MDERQKQCLVDDAKGLAKWFAVDIVIKIFGFTIWEYHFPPQSSKS